MAAFDITQFQPTAWTSLARSFEAGKVAGTYLVYGREGTGRWALAISLAALLNCEHPTRGGPPVEVLRPCGACRACRMIFGLNFEGLHFALPIPPHKSSDEAIDLTAKALDLKRGDPFRILSGSGNMNIPISLARDIKRRLSLKADTGVTRLVLFYQMERMLAASADALLKLIEEPPADTVIVLIATRPEALLPTIASRSRKVRVHRIPSEAIAGYMTSKYEVSPTRASLLARLSDGSLGRALEMNDTADDDETSRRAVGFLLFRSLLSEPAPDVVARIVDMVDPRNRGQAEHLLGLWQSLLSDCARYALMGSDEGIINLDFLPDIRKLSTHLTGSDLPFVLLANIKIALADLQRNVHIHGALAALALRTISRRSHRPGH